MVLFSLAIQLVKVMPRRRGNPLPFDTRGGKIVMCRFLLESKNYKTLSANSRALMLELQLHWRNDKPVDMGVREAAKRICCTEKTVRKAFNELEERGFIVCEEYAYFNSKLGSKPRSWRLTWLPFNYNKPTNDWEEWEGN